MTIGCDTKNDSDEVLILNVDGYVGESAMRALIRAILLGKRVRYLEKPSDTFFARLAWEIERACGAIQRGENPIGSGSAV